MKLLYRSLKKHDEFVGDYVTRIGRNNGYCKPKAFESLLRDYFYKEYEGRSNDLHRKAIPRLALEKLLHRNIAIDEFGRYNHDKRCIWSKCPGCCTKCENEESYTRFYWWLSSYRYCHIHGCPIFSEDLGRTSGRRKFDPDPLPSSLVLEIVRSVENNDLVQALVLDEIERFHIDYSIARALFENFHVCGVFLGFKKDIYSALFSDKNIGNSASGRLQNIARLFSNHVGNEKFWLRMIALTFRSYVKGGLSYQGHWFRVNDEYNRFCSFVMCTDFEFKAVLASVSGYRRRVEMNEFNIDSLVTEGPKLPDLLLSKIKLSIFSCRRVDSWVSSIQKAEDFWKKKDPREFYASLIDRFI